MKQFQNEINDIESNVFDEIKNILANKILIDWRDSAKKTSHVVNYKFQDMGLK